MRSTLPSTGLMSCVTKRTAASVSRRCLSMSATTACWLARSRLVSGSSHSRRRGSSASAWPMRSRCCSPPESSPDGSVGEARRADRASTQRVDAFAIGRGAGRGARIGGRRRRATTRSRPRSDGVARQRALLRDVADPPVAPRAHGLRRARVIVPDVSGSSPRMARSRVVLPEPLGPSTAMNSPGSTARSSPLQSSRSPRRSDAPSDLAAGRPSLLQRVLRSPRCSPASTRGKSGPPGASR